ncbi:hypothetical protein GGI07_002996 [Coemansia sp. Benny D115]|nr:hypothetical protein GGI07_002996 [Coemansia sp. Benny D115]
MSQHPPKKPQTEQVNEKELQSQPNPPRRRRKKTQAQVQVQVQVQSRKANTLENTDDCVTDNNINIKYESHDLAGRQPDGQGGQSTTINDPVAQVVIPSCSSNSGSRRKLAELEIRRKQNRDAAARHRQRQQRRLEELTHKEAVLSQQVSELELEILTLRRHREGLEAPERDSFTTSILAMIDNVNEMRNSLMQYTVESQELVLEVRNA